MNAKIIALVLPLALLGSMACDRTSQPGASAQSVSQKLNGTWGNDLMTVKIDFPGGRYDGIAMGAKFERKLTLVKELGNTVEFKTSDGQEEATILAQFQEDGSVMLTKEGGIPLSLKRI